MSLNTKLNRIYTSISQIRTKVNAEDVPIEGVASTVVNLLDVKDAELLEKENTIEAQVLRIGELEIRIEELESGETPSSPAVEGMYRVESPEEMRNIPNPQDGDVVHVFKKYKSGYTRFSPIDTITFEPYLLPSFFQWLSNLYDKYPGSFFSGTGVTAQLPFTFSNYYTNPDTGETVGNNDELVLGINATANMNLTTRKSTFNILVQDNCATGYGTRRFSIRWGWTMTSTEGVEVPNYYLEMRDGSTGMNEQIQLAGKRITIKFRQPVYKTLGVNFVNLEPCEELADFFKLSFTEYNDIYQYSSDVNDWVLKRNSDEEYIDPYENPKYYLEDVAYPEIEGGDE